MPERPERDYNDVDVDSRQAPLNDHERRVKHLRHEIESRKAQLREMSKNVAPNMESGAIAAIHTAGTVLHHSKPWRLPQSAAFWAMGIGMFTIAGIGWNFGVGLFAGLGNSTPLPNNAPVSMRFGHGVSNVGKPFAGTILTGTTQAVDAGLRVQLTGSQQPVGRNNFRNTTPISDSRSVTYIPAVPVVRYAPPQ
ncbi:MAG: hypothetical protein WBB28_20875 [Crinalium sp.]